MQFIGPVKWAVFGHNSQAFRFYPLTVSLDGKTTAYYNSKHFSHVLLCYVMMIHTFFLIGGARWKTWGRGPGVQGPRVQGPGVWKTWGLVENTKSNMENIRNHYFSPKYALSLLKWEGKILLAKLWWISIQYLGLKQDSWSKTTNKSFREKENHWSAKVSCTGFLLGRVICVSQ